MTPRLVIAGLDPAIHPSTRTARPDMGRRVEPGDDARREGAR